MRIAIPTLVALATLLAPSPALAADRETVQVTGTATVSGKPDLLAANLAVETTAATVGDAMEQAATAATRMRDALVRAGVAAADLQTTNLDVSSRRNDEQEITGYTVQQGLTAKIRDMPRAGTIMSGAVAAGGDAARVNGVSFAIEDDTALLAEARRKAFADARGKAELYARAADRQLGRVVGVSEQTIGFAGRDKLAVADYAAPIEPGRQELSVSITVEWAFA